MSTISSCRSTEGLFLAELYAGLRLEAFHDTNAKGVVCAGETKFVPDGNANIVINAVFLVVAVEAHMREFDTVIVRSS